MSDSADDVQAIVALFEAAEPFTGLDLDDFLGAAPVDDDAPAPQPRVSGESEPRAAWRDERRWICVVSEAGPSRRSVAYRIGPKDRGGWPWGMWRRLRFLSRLDQSDTDNATRLIAHFGADLRVRIQEGGQKPLFVSWTGTHWDDVTGVYGARSIAQRVGDLIKHEARFLTPTVREAEIIAGGVIAEAKPESERTAADREDIAKAAAAALVVAKRKGKRVDFGVSCKNEGRINAMINQAAPRLLVDPAAFNADPLRLVTPTQTLRWWREVDDECPDPSVERHIARFEAREGHDRRDLITIRIPHAYDARAECPRWMAFLRRFQPHEADRRFIQVTAGIGLLGIGPQVLVFHFGEGANGKSVALEVISRVLGPLAAGLPAEAIAGDDQGGLKPSPEIARLFGKRFVRISEIKEGVPLQEAFVKRITGSEAFPARNLFEGYFEFKPQFIPHMSGNGYPKISGTDNGIWRRMRIVRWPVVLADDEQRDFEEVVGELMEEASGILRWLVEGACIYLGEGLLSPPSVLHETAVMRAKMDPVKKFVEERLEITGDEADAITGGNLYKAYTEWADGDHTPVSLTRFGRDISKIRNIAKDTSGRLILYRGIRLKADPRSPSDGNPGWGDPRGF